MLEFFHFSLFIYIHFFEALNFEVFFMAFICYILSEISNYFRQKTPKVLQYKNCHLISYLWLCNCYEEY